jgi:hypothetical protein
MTEDFKVHSESTSDTEAKIEDGLELNLGIIENLVSKYGKSEVPFGTYDLTNEDGLEFTSAFNRLRGELVTRSSEYRKNLMSTPLYPNTLKGKVYEIVDKILKQHSFRENERARMLNSREIPNPYLTSIEYIDVTIQPLVVNKQVQPELLNIAVENVREFDNVGKENINTYQQGV